MAPWQGPLADPFRFKLGGVDALAKVGQFPFYLMLVAALVSLGRRLSNNSWTAYLPAILVSLVPWTVRQATTPAVDLMMAALFVTSLALAQHRHDGARMPAAALSGLALGLAVGVKFVALTYAPLVAAPILVGMARRRDWRGAAVWVGVLVASGAPWYVRNWAVAGNPLFPLDITIGNWAMWPGAYERAAMLASPFHAPSWDAALAVARQAAGWWLAPVALLGVVTGLVAAWRQPAWRAYAWIVPVGLVWHFALVPYSSQDRFLLWAVALALLPLAAWPVKRGWAIALALLAAVPVVLTVFGAAPWNSAVGDGLFDPAGWRVALIAAALLVGGWALSRRLGAPTWLSWARGFATALLIAGWLASPHGGTFVRTNVAAIRELPFAGYVDVWKRRPKVVAYAGRNRPYYLAGREGLTRARYVNLDGCATCRLHDYVGRIRRNGTLDLRREKDDWRGQGADEQRWLAALQARGVEMLMIEPLHPLDRAYLPHDAEGYPLELAWAARHPELLTPLPGDGAYRLFALRNVEFGVRNEPQ
jgi:4-amino-4-deoxy-L-arabinose transferase-like glycosyltransferase